MTGTKKKPGDSKAKVVRGAPSLAPKAIEAETVGVEGVEADFLAFITEARAIDAAKVTSFRGDPSLAYHNVVAGLDAVLAERAAVEASGLRVDWRALEEMPRIALGLVFASERIDGPAGVNGALQTDLARGRVLRDIALSSVTSLASAGAIPADSASKLKGAAGPLNLGKLLVKVAAFFNKHGDAVKGMTPFKPELAREAAADGREAPQDREARRRDQDQAPRDRRRAARSRRAGRPPLAAPRGPRTGRRIDLGARALGACPDATVAAARVVEAPREEARRPERQASDLTPSLTAGPTRSMIFRCVRAGSGSPNSSLPMECLNPNSSDSYPPMKILNRNSPDSSPPMRSLSSNSKTPSQRR